MVEYNSCCEIHIEVWLSLVERYVRDVEAAGSNPVTPIGKRGVKQAVMSVKMALRLVFVL